MVEGEVLLQTMDLMRKITALLNKNGKVAKRAKFLYPLAGVAYFTLPLLKNIFFLFSSLLSNTAPLPPIKTAYF